MNGGKGEAQQDLEGLRKAVNDIVEELIGLPRGKTVSQDNYTDEIIRLFQAEVTRVREDQIMQDELSLHDFDIDESKLIEWRLERLAALQQTKHKEEN